ncbi:hypothetical protein SNOG_09672 [Parastagonospora nodorum SN15]|uniref:Uncharacterized protein n=1 Tax=Phaeosphaeria nodorum (strain SN15 / ATCC MYA-4574 / FGSC 10173) TaxID=321614 RepID=Q0UEZ2_PHANO|nr:hypothetical protein SNOG_09672 [Parastagonospora nodorum SN15]EAT82937.1 hypothetical protein SNOG_09672 [Parastagonospora nodorum SN15]
MKAFFVLALAAFVAAGPLCTTSTSSSVAPVATPKPKTCNRICGDETLVCASGWYSVQRERVGKVLAGLAASKARVQMALSEQSLFWRSTEW